MLKKAAALFTYKKAAALYADGLSLTAVGAEFDVDPGVIRKEFLKFGIQRRQPGRPQAIP